MLPALSLSHRRRVVYQLVYNSRRCFWGRKKTSEKQADESLLALHEEDGEAGSPAPLSEQQRNKSRLHPVHRRHMLGLPPDWTEFAAAAAAQPPDATDEHAGVPDDWRTLQRQRQLWAMYGAASGIQPAVCWPVDEEWRDLSEYEALAHADSLQTMLDKERVQQEEQRADAEQRMLAIERNLAKLREWKHEIVRRKNEQISEREEEAARRAERVAEIRDMFGFNIDARDPRFVQAMEERDEIDKKEAKVRRKQKKAERLARQIARGVVTVQKEAVPAADEDATQQNTAESTG